MNFSTDRDLLVLEPHVFVDVPMMSQQRLSVTDASLSGTTLTTATGDFAAAQVDAGCVLLFTDNDTAVEVVSRTDANTVEVSLPRADPNTAPIPPAPGSFPNGTTGLKVVARTFELQAATVHSLLLRLAGIDTDNPDEPLTADSIVSRSVMAHLEALGTLELTYAAAATITGDNDEVRAKADRYRKRFNDALREACVLLDLNGDGFADQQRRFGLIHMNRV